MKNKILIYIIAVLLLLFSYCLYKNNPVVSLHNFPNNAEIIYCGEKEIYYYIDKAEESFRDIDIYSYDIKKKKNVKISTFYDTDYIITDLINMGDYIYLINKESQENYAITQINTENKTKKNIYTWSGNISFNYLFNVGDKLVLMNINTISDKNKNEYTIDIIDTNTLKSEQIVKKEYDKEKGMGTIVSSVCVNNDFIYSFENIENAKETKFNIVKYNIKGQEIEKHTLSLDAFLKINDPEIYSDAVVDIYVKGNYYILSTLNQRKIIYKESNNKLKEISIPPELYDRYPSKYRILSIPKETNEETYFIDSFSEKKQLIVFNNKKGKFKKIELPQNMKDYETVYRNEGGDLVIHTANQSYLIKHNYMKP